MVKEIIPSPSDASLPWISPGWIDLQVNGLGGYGFNHSNLTTAAILQICRRLRADGVTRFLPTITTSSEDDICSACERIARACGESREVNAAVAGIHVEGPFISREEGPRGAHPLAHVRPPCGDELARWQSAAGGRVKLVTLSPEYVEAPSFIARAVASGVSIAIGHTNATSEQIDAAVTAGASLSTHLGNGCHTVLRRHPNYLWDQLADDRLTATFIADGHHLPVATLKCFVRMKTPTRSILVSDVTDLAGSSPGRYETSLGSVEMLQEGKLVVAGQRELLAGAAAPLKRGIEHLLATTDVSLRDAMSMVTENPARAIHLPSPALQVGQQANLVLFRIGEDKKIAVERVIFGEY